MMDIQENHKAADRNSLKLFFGYRLFFCYAIILVVNWFSNYQLFRDFGLYMDDYYRILKLLLSMREGFWETVSTIFSPPVNVRPLHGGLILALSYAGFNLGGLGGVYVIGYVILSINAMLCFVLIRALTRNELTALIGALAFVLYPGSTTKIWITAALGIQPSITLVLLAFVFYIKEKRWLAYLFAAISLFGYETAYWVFFAAPLFLIPWNRSIRKKLLTHGIIMACIFASFFIFKIVDSDPRLQDNSLRTMLLTSVRHLIDGPIYNIRGQVSVLVKTVTIMDATDIVVLIIGSFTILLTMLVAGPRKDSGDTTMQPGRFGIMAATDPSLFEGNKGNYKLMLIGVVMMILSFPLTLNGSARTVYGMGSRLHLATSIGVVFLYAGVCGCILEFFDNFNQGMIGRVLLSFMASMLILNGIQVQQDYRNAYGVQTRFWQDLTNVCFDFHEDMLIFFDPQSLRYCRSIPIFDWSSAFILENIYEFPEKWKRKPRVYIAKKPGLAGFLDSSDALTLSDLEKAQFISVSIQSDLGRKIDKEKRVFVYYKNNSLTRLTGAASLDAVDRPDKTASHILENYSKGVLYPLLIKND
jgi:hypothetical protein